MSTPFEIVCFLFVILLTLSVLGYRASRSVKFSSLYHKCPRCGHRVSSQNVRCWKCDFDMRDVKDAD